MFRENNKIIMVDDSEFDLKTLSQQFHLKGIGCRTFEFPTEIPLAPLLGVRVAFFDVNLLSGSGTNTYVIAETFARVLPQFIAKENGPFALIFWTKNKEMVEDIKQYMNTLSEDDIKDHAIPYFVDCLEKDYTEALHDKIYDIFHDSTLGSLLAFENDLTDTADRALKSILDINQNFNHNWGDNEGIKKSFSYLCTKLALNELGGSAREHFSLAMNKAVVHFVKSSLPANDNIWKHLTLSKTQFGKVDRHLPDRNMINSKLNTFFMLKVFVGANDISKRGCVLIIKKKEFKEITHRVFEEWLNERFKGYISDNDCKPVAIEISAACDDGQNKPRIPKYIIGISSDIELIPDRSKPITSAISGIPPVFVNDKICWLYFDNNFVFTINLSTEIELDTLLFVLNKEVVDLISTTNAQHTSRIGITSA